MQYKTKAEKIFRQHRGLKNKMKKDHFISAPTIKKAIDGGNVTFASKFTIFNALVQYGLVELGEENTHTLFEKIEIGNKE